MFDCLVGVNLLREGLDLPEVTLVAILDADKEGFLRSETSLVQTIGRAARNADARVILYADKVTDSMQMAIDETDRRRAVQRAYNKEHGITPRTVLKKIKRGIESDAATHKDSTRKAKESEEMVFITIEYVDRLEQEMLTAAEELEFEKAARLRDRVLQLRDHVGKPLSEVEVVDDKGGSSGGQGKGRRGRKRTSSNRSRVPRPKSV